MATETLENLDAKHGTLQQTVVNDVTLEVIYVPDADDLLRKCQLMKEEEEKKKKEKDAKDLQRNVRLISMAIEQKLKDYPMGSYDVANVKLAWTVQINLAASENPSMLKAAEAYQKLLDSKRFSFSFESTYNNWEARMDIIIGLKQ